jgi:hypothetical protein
MAARSTHHPRRSHAIAAALAVACCAILSHPAASEVYRWTDAQGNLHFTSDLNRVPTQYRNQAATSKPNPSGISVLRDGATLNHDERARAVKERVLDLRRQQRKAAANQQPARATPKPDPEPQKYEYNCRKRTKNGRCQRFRRAAWDEWNKRQ